jgi:hypothetical protein
MSGRTHVYIHRMCCRELKIDVVGPGPSCQQHCSEAGQVIYLPLSLSVSLSTSLSLTQSLPPFPSTSLVRMLLFKWISRVAKSSRATQLFELCKFKSRIFAFHELMWSVTSILQPPGKGTSWDIHVDPVYAILLCSFHWIFLCHFDQLILYHTNSRVIKAHTQQFFRVLRFQIWVQHLICQCSSANTAVLLEPLYEIWVIQTQRSVCL